MQSSALTRCYTASLGSQPLFCKLLEPHIWIGSCPAWSWTVCGIAIGTSIDFNNLYLRHWSEPCSTRNGGEELGGRGLRPSPA